MGRAPIFGWPGNFESSAMSDACVCVVSACWRRRIHFYRYRIRRSPLREFEACEWGGDWMNEHGLRWMHNPQILTSPTTISVVYSCTRSIYRNVNIEHFRYLDYYLRENEVCEIFEVEWIRANEPWFASRLRNVKVITVVQPTLGKGARRYRFRAFDPGFSLKDHSRRSEIHSNDAWQARKVTTVQVPWMACLSRALARELLPWTP